MTGPTFPPGRYGRRRAPRRSRRWVVPLLAGLVVLAGVLVAVVMYANQVGKVQTGVTRVELATDHVTVTFQVVKPADRGARCLLRARDVHGAEVGRATVAVPPGRRGENSQTVTYTLSTSGRPITGEVYGCALATGR